ncbi:MAG: SLBB domain-containing protein [Terracidiphilus sp.]|jgi:protein involved in polysaccharide export with SLBB domain
MLDIPESFKDRFLAILVRIAQSARLSGKIFVLFLLILSATVLCAQIPPNSSQSGDPLGTQTPSSVDCTDPLMAVSTECTTLLQNGSGAMALPQSGAAMSSQAGATPSNPIRNYSDIEQFSPQYATQFQAQQTPEPLTEFQKFIASSTGEILPIFGANLFRSVPSTFAPLNMAPVPPNYVLGPGDELRIRVWGQINTQANVRIDRSGDIYLPQVGPVHVAGLSSSDLDAHLRQAVGRVFRNFDLIADVGQIRAIQVYVTGQARRPGVYTVSSLSTLVNTLFSSGGPSVEGSLRNIELRRGGTIVTDFDLYTLLIGGDKSKDVKLQDGDVIFIPPVSSQVAATGSVRNPGIYELRTGETLNNLLRDAGGLSSVASNARVSVERLDDHHDRQAMEVAYDAAGLATILADGDLIRVLAISPVYQKTVTLRGNTANPGRFAWHDGMRINELIPDKDSLLTRNYWWRRTQLGLPAPEFEPMSPAILTQPADNYSVGVRFFAHQDVSAPKQPGQSDQSSPQQSPSGVQPNQTADSQPRPTYGQNQPLTAAQRASSTSLAAEQEATPSSRPIAQRTEVQLPAPEIDWDYAVIERIDAETLKTKLIPFDLGKLVLQHDASQDLELQPNDVVSIFSEADIRVPIAKQTKLVRLDGEFAHSGIYSVQPGETLRQLVERAGGFTPNAYLYGSEFTRQSTRAIQQARIDEYVQNMNLSIERGTLALVAEPAATPQDLASSAAAGAMERDLLARLKQIRATGRIVLEFKPASIALDSVPSMAMEDGDRFVVPSVPSSVNVVGAVYDQNSFLYAPGRRVGSYLHLAGGPNKDADRKHSFVIRADGEVISYEMSRGPWGNEFYNLPMNPGDTIVVPDKTLKPSLLRGIFDYTQLFSQFALGAAALSIIAP